MYAVIGFLAIWSIGWLTAVATSWGSPNATINDRPATPDEARLMLWGMLGIGLLIASGTLAMIGYALNTRVEIGNGEIREFDWRGRLKVRGSLKSAVIGAGGENQAKIETDGGAITVSTSIKNYGELKTIVEDKTMAAVEGKRFPVSRYVPTFQVFRPRWGQMHLSSFVWIGTLLYMGSKSIDDSGPGVFELALFVFLLPGIWMQLSGWVERISLGPEGIEAIDFLGRSRVRASLEEIVEGETVKGSESSSVQIHTLRGTVSAGSGYWKKGKLLEEVRKVVAGRDPVR